MDEIRHDSVSSKEDEREKELIACLKQLNKKKRPIRRFFARFDIITHILIMNCVIATMHEVCHNVRIEPKLQPLSREQFHYRSADVEDGACLDVSVDSFYVKFKLTFAAPSYASSPLDQC